MWFTHLPISKSSMYWASGFVAPKNLAWNWQKASWPWFKIQVITIQCLVDKIDTTYADSEVTFKISLKECSLYSIMMNGAINIEACFQSHESRVSSTDPIRRGSYIVIVLAAAQIMTGHAEWTDQWCETISITLKHLEHKELHAIQKFTNQVGPKT